MTSTNDSVKTSESSSFESAGPNESEKPIRFASATLGAKRHVQALANQAFEVAVHVEVGGRLLEREAARVEVVRADAFAAVLQVRRDAGGRSCAHSRIHRARY